MVIFVEDEKDLQETDELKSPDRILEEGLDKFNDLVDIIKDALNKGEGVCIHGNKPSISDVNTEEKVIEAVNKLGEIDMVALMNTIRETAREYLRFCYRFTSCTTRIFCNRKFV